MIRDLLKWVAPGALTIICGTWAAMAMSAPAVLADLGAQSRTSLDIHGFSWSRVQQHGRDFRLTGTVENTEGHDAAISLLETVPGVRHVSDAVTIAPLAAPYVINVLVEDGAISLSGSVPNAELLELLKSRPGVAVTDLAIRSGQPPEEDWRAAVDFALAQAELVETGSFELSGLRLDGQGSANSQRALGALHQALAHPPSGLALGTIAIEPVRAAPYRWTAEFDGQRIAISGYVPEEQLVERFRTADISGLPVATGLSLASGAPENFAEISRILVEQLARLDHGNATIVDGVSTLTGAPPSLEIAQAVNEALSGTGSIVQLTPPRVTDYWVSVTRQTGGILVFDGYVPDEATRTAFSEAANADTAFLKLGSGAPAFYRSGVDFGLKVLDQMAEGRFSLNDTALSVSGTAETAIAYRVIYTLLETELPQGITLASPDIRPPQAAQYSFSARRAPDETITLSGLVPSLEMEQALLAAAGANAVSDLDYASGEPTGFADSAQQGLGFLPWLSEGQVTFDGTSWTISGTPASQIDKATIETEYTIRGLAQSGWSLNLTEPEVAEAPKPPATPEPEPVAPAPEEPAAAEAEGEAEPVAPETDSVAAQPAATAEEAPIPAAEPQPTPASAAAFALCQERMAELSAHNAILFQSGNAIIAASANAELDLFAEALALCPDTKIYVEGHTDSDGDDRLNLALSVARAEAVVNALIERGIGFERLYAIGYGESQPVADNATSEGKRQNRRIVVTVHENED